MTTFRINRPIDGVMPNEAQQDYFDYCLKALRAGQEGDYELVVIEPDFDLSAASMVSVLQEVHRFWLIAPGLDEVLGLVSFSADRFSVELWHDGEIKTEPLLDEEVAEAWCIANGVPPLDEWGGNE